MAEFEGWEWFYLNDDAENVGPFTTEELTGFYAEGSITDDTYIWAEQCEGWQTIGLSPELRSIVSAGGAPAAPEAAATAQADAPAEEEVKKESFHSRAKSMSARRQSVSLPPVSSEKAPVVLLKELSQKTYQKELLW